MAGIRAWAKHAEFPALRRSGLAMVIAVVLQVGLGFAAFVFRAKPNPDGIPSLGQALVNTAHQTNGAVLLGITVLLVLWVRRLLVNPPAEETAAEPAS